MPGGKAGGIFICIVSELDLVQQAATKGSPPDGEGVALERVGSVQYHSLEVGGVRPVGRR